MQMLTWIVRTLVILLIVRVVLRFLMAGTAASARGRASGRKAEHAGGALVRDPQCGTYIPQSRALTVGIGTNAQYFCSAACRDAFVAAHNSVAS